MMDILNGFALALTPVNILAALVGALIGTAVGVLPGMGPTAAVGILVTATVTLSPETGLIALAAVYYGTQYGDSMTAILMRIPSEPPAVVLAVDGYPMAQKGRAGPALAIAAISSFIGAALSLIGLMIAAPTVSRVALLLGPADYAVIAVIALLVLSRFSGGSFSTRLLSLAIGLAATTIGLDMVTGIGRFTFDSPELLQGVEIAPVVIGLYGLAELLHLAGRGGGFPAVEKIPFRKLFPSRTEWRKATPAAGRGAVVGFLMGVLPGPTLSLANFASHSLERRISKHPEEFGKGAVQGVAGPGAADNAAVSGNLLPFLALGLPFTSVTAVLFAGLLLHGIQPGPLLISQHPELFWGLIAAMFVGNVALLLLNFPMVGVWIRLLRIPSPILLALLMVLMFTGVYGFRNSVFDLVVLLVSGVAGYLMKLVDLDRTVLVLGLVLGPVLETSIRQALFISRGDPTVFVTTPMGIVGVVVLVGVVVGPPLRRALRRRGGGQTPSEPSPENAGVLR